MFESDFADIRVSLILAILLMKKSLKQLALHELSGSILFLFFYAKCISFCPITFLGSSETKFV